MLNIAYSWVFDVNGASSGQFTKNPKPTGEGFVHLDNCSSELAALANALDRTRTQLNDVVTIWKDAAGPEQDSNMGRSNSVSNSTTNNKTECGNVVDPKDDETDDYDDENDDGEDEN